MIANIRGVAGSKGRTVIADREDTISVRYELVPEAFARHVERMMDAIQRTVPTP